MTSPKRERERERERESLEFRILLSSIKRLVLTYGTRVYTWVFMHWSTKGVCVSFLKRGIHTLKHKASIRKKAYTYEPNLLGGAISMTLKLSLPLNMASYIARIALYAKHVNSKWHLSSTVPSLHTLHAFKFVTFWYHDATSIPKLWVRVRRFSQMVFRPPNVVEDGSYNA